MIHDPEGRAIEIVQYPEDSLVTKTRGQFLPDGRVSGHLRHVGFVVTKLDEEMRFYTQVLGFHEFWRGSSNGSVLSWINMQVPDGDDYVEFMLYKDAPPADRQGSANHLCLLVDDIGKTTADLKAKAEKAGYTRTMEPKTGVNRKRQLNLYDAEGTRTELMEPVTVDGKPAVSSTAPPPGAY
jgi:lactoylglutathione lyase